MRVRVLGPVEIVDGQDRPVPLGRAKQRVLLAILALRAGATVPREVLVAGLWGASPPRSAAANLSTYVSELRKLIPVEARDGGYLLPDAEVDAREFERLAAEGRAALADGRADVAAELLARAGELWRGPVFAGLAVPEVVRADVDRLDALRAAAAEAADRAAPDRAAEPPRQLPATARAFTGRSAELAWLDAALARQAKDGALMLAAIVGSAGTGKTALAVRWARGVADHFPDGQLYADLRGYGACAPAAPIEVLTAFLRALGVRDDRVPADEPAAAAAFRSALAGRRVVVVLDNASSAEQVRPLLPGDPECLVLVTSRSRLTDLVAIDGADLLPIGGLDPRDTRRLLTAVLGEERVLAEPAAAAALGELCAHLPLALRLAAARVTTTDRTLAGYVAELSGGARLDLFAVDGEPSTVRAMFDASYRLLPDDVQRLFRLLAVVPGQTFTARAAAALLDVPEERAAGLIGRLVSASVVERRGPGHYGMHDLLAVYAGEKAAEHPATGGERQRLLTGYLADTASAVELLGWAMAREPVEQHGAALRFADHAEALAWLDANLPALTAAASDALAHGPRSVAWQLADQLRGYFWLRRRSAEWLAVATAALTAATAEGDLRGEIVARHCLGDAHWSLGRYAAATAHYESAIAACGRVDLPERHSGLLINIGAVAREQGQLDAAVGYLREALDIKRRNGFAETTVRANLGVIYQEMGRFAEALHEHTRVLELNTAEVTADRAFSLIAVGATHRALGRVDLAVGFLEDALALHRETGNRVGEVNALEELAVAERDRGDLPAALSCASEAAELAAELGNPRAEVATTLALASVHLRLGDRWEAVRGYERGLAAARRDRVRLAEVEALLGLAEAKRPDAPAEAVGLARAALASAARSGYHGLASTAERFLADWSERVDSG